jgi:hypothetical protein
MNFETFILVLPLGGAAALIDPPKVVIFGNLL